MDFRLRHQGLLSYTVCSLLLIANGTINTLEASMAVLAPIAAFATWDKIMKNKDSY
jgi:hypothetical protein